MKNAPFSFAKFAILPFCSLLLAGPAMADWQIENSASEFHFVTTKAGKPGVLAVQEVQAFKDISGKVNDNGNIEVSVDLASVETGVAVRDQRIKDLLFAVGVTPKATFVGQVDIGLIRKLTTGASKDLDLNGTITLCGQTRPVLAKLRIVKLSGNALLVETRAPFIVNTNDFGLQSGVEALRDVVGLNVLSGAAPVSFSIVLK